MSSSSPIPKIYSVKNSFYRIDDMKKYYERGIIKKSSDKKQLTSDRLVEPKPFNINAKTKT